jgi:hypothetical protein
MLHLRQDGCYYIRHFYSGHSTWQVVGDGVVFLRNRGIKEEGQYFPTDLFMDLWQRGLVYYGDAIPTGERTPCRDSGVSAVLRASVEEFYRHIYKGQVERAWPMVQDDDRTRTSSPDQFKHDVGEFQMTAWQLQDLLVYDLSPESQGDFGALRLGVAHLKLKSAADSSGGAWLLLKQYWSERDGRWLVIWLGLRSAVAQSIQT